MQRLTEVESARVQFLMACYVRAMFRVMALNRKIILKMYQTENGYLQHFGVLYDVFIGDLKVDGASERAGKKHAIISTKHFDTYTRKLHDIRVYSRYVVKCFARQGN